MPQSLANVVVHLVFSTKGRRTLLRDMQLRQAMHKYLGGTSSTLDCNPIIVGGVEDHVHLLARQARTISISEWVKELKRVTSLWAKEHDRRLAGFQWQAGYGAFSVSQSEGERFWFVGVMRRGHRSTQRPCFKDFPVSRLVVGT